MPVASRTIMTLTPSITSALLSWYDTNGRDLPWRSRTGSGIHPNPYHVLLSEFMLQQTTVAAVIPYFKKLTDSYPTIESLASEEPDQVLRLWEGLGYYSRARNLHTAASQVVHQYGGAIPNDPDTLKKLPGIGDYTAAAVTSIAFGVKVPALDANNLRVWSRLLASLDKKRIARVFTRVLPPDRPGDFNQALMDLGSLLCTPKDPQCPACPISRWCRAYRSGRVEEFPKKKPPTETTRIEAAVGIIIEGGKILVQKRPENGLLAGLWEFPGGKINRTQGAGRRAQKKIRIQASGASKSFKETLEMETPEEAVVREVREETGLRVQVCDKLGVFTHAYTRFRVKLQVFLCKRKSGRLHRPDARWVTLEELEGLPMPGVNRRIVKKLEERLEDA
jgi:A/G-specific adenine glycosylase